MWRLESNRASWHTAQFQLHLDLSRPQAGWRDVKLDGQAAGGELFQVRLPGEDAPQAVVDRYVRQADLVVTYAQSPDRTVRPQLVWRALRDGQLRVGVELIVSMQTSLLESDPSVQIGHQVLGELLAVGDQSAETAGPGSWESPVALLHRPEQLDQASFVTAVHPTDFQTMRIAGDEGLRTVTLSLFPQSLEKGVIRRGRVRGIYVPRDGDVDYARQCLAELTDAAPPLTT